MNTLLYFLVLIVCILALARILPGFHVTGWGPATLAAVILAALNAVLKPVLFVLTLPLTIVTLGLFLFVLNAMMLWLTARIVPGFRIDGFMPALIASLILSAVGMLWKSATKEA